MKEGDELAEEIHITITHPSNLLLHKVQNAAVVVRFLGVRL